MQYIQQGKFQQLTKAYEGDAGYDICSNENITIPSNQYSLVHTGLKLIIPVGYFCRISPRSGLALKHGIDVGAGIIDQQYTGEVNVILFNHSGREFVIKEGDRIAQLIVHKLHNLQVIQVQNVENIQPNSRQQQGFGSTGIQAIQNDQLQEFSDEETEKQIIVAKKNENDILKGIQILQQGCDVNGDILISGSTIDENEEFNNAENQSDKDTQQDKENNNTVQDDENGAEQNKENSVEQDDENGVEQNKDNGVENGVEQDQENGVEQDKENEVENGVEQNKDNGVENSVEQDNENGFEQNDENGVEQNKDTGVNNSVEQDIGGQ